jgi:N-acylglucosamine-6-phosphate 2-epimerase
MSLPPRMAGGLVVSCQAYPGEPMQDPHVMTAMARAVVEGGAVGLRAQGIEDITSIRSAVTVPLIGLVKVGTDGVFITPTVADCLAVAEAGADVVALDGTTRRRPDGSSLRECFDAVHAAGALVMADCGSTRDVEASLEAGADCLGTTLAGYSGVRPRTDGPDLAFIAETVATSTVPVLAEGRIRTPGEALQCLDLGVFAVVVGTAITHPTSITRTFTEAIRDKVGDRQERDRQPPSA